MRYGQNISDETKIKLFDESVRIFLECENRTDITKEELKHYGNACGMAGYKILRLLFENRVVEPGRDGSLI